MNWTTWTRAFASLAIATVCVGSTHAQTQDGDTQGASRAAAPEAAHQQASLQAMPAPNVLARGDVVAPSLRELMQAAEPGDRLAAYVVMRDQLRGVELERAVNGAAQVSQPTTARARRRQVAERLKTHAATTQQGVRQVLDAAAAAGLAEIRAGLWMGNAVVFSAESSVIDELSRLPGVDRIRPVVDTPIELIQDAQPVTAPTAPAAPVPAAPVPARPLMAAPAAPPPGPPMLLAGDYPFSDDFESGGLLPHWTVGSTGSGYAAVDTAEGPFGDFHVLMATSTNSVDSTASMTVELDLAGQTDVGIRFRHKEFGDENHPEDGVFVSADGVTWHLALSLQNGGNQYVSKWVSLDPLLPGFGITYTSTFFVRFQWRDNFDIPSDGFAFDEIEIGPGVGVQPPPDLEPHLVALQASKLWEQGFEGSGILVGTIDSGVDWQHPDLVDRIWTNPGEVPNNGLDDDNNGFIDDIHGWDFEFNGADVTSSDPHGTQSAGLMVGDGSSGRATGMAPSATLAVCEVGNEVEYWLAQQYLLDIGVDVISSSYSYKWPSSPDYHMHRQLCDVELAAGIIHANSIGNQGALTVTHPLPFNISTPGNVPSPFAHPDLEQGGRSSVMACGGINIADDTLYNPSGRGPSAWEDITLYDAAYGKSQDSAYWDYPVGGFGGGLPGLIKPDVVTYTNTVMTTNLNSGYIMFSGTSAATPQLGGAMALLRDVQPAAMPRHIAAALELTAVDLGTPGKDNSFGSGKIQVWEAARRLVVLARFAPTEAQLSQPFSIELFGPPGITLYGFYQLDLVTNLGPLNLAQPMFLLGTRVADAQGEARWDLAVPNDPALIGLTVWFQAAAEPQDGTWGAGPFVSVPDSLTVTP